MITPAPIVRSHAAGVGRDGGDLDAEARQRLDAAHAGLRQRLRERGPRAARMHATRTRPGANDGAASATCSRAIASRSMQSAATMTSTAHIHHLPRDDMFRSEGPSECGDRTDFRISL